MPRAKGRGGARQGTPGVAYPQRTDMQAPKQAVTVGHSAQYGQATALAGAQQAVPLPNNAAATQQAMQPGSDPRVMGQQVAAGVDLAAEAGAPVFRPSDRPHEPVTAGAPLGAGPSGLPAPPNPLVNLAAFLGGQPQTAETARNLAAVQAMLAQTAGP